MADFLQIYLTKLAQIQKKHTKILAIAVILITIFLGIGLRDLTINSDFRKEMPKELPIFKLNDRITDKFGGQDSVVIAIELDDSVDSKTAVRDIRDPRVIQAMILLDEDLRGETSVTSTSSPASFFRGQKGVTPENITQTLRSNPMTDGFFSKNYKMALMFVNADIGTGEEQIQNFDELIQEHIKTLQNPQV